MTPTRNFDLLIFDWDGTLFDSTTLIAKCIQAACAEMGVPVPSDERASYVIGMGLVAALQYAAPDLAPERYQELGERYRKHYFARQHEIVFFDGTLAMLQDLKARGHHLAVATGKSRRGLDQALNGSDLRGLFEATRTAEETAPKPDPRMLAELMDHFQVSPARTVMIGDTTHDLQMAMNAGAAGVAVEFGAHPAQQLQALHPLYSAGSIQALHRWLDENA